MTDGFKAAIDHFPASYKKAVEAMAEELSAEFVTRYLCKAYSMYKNKEAVEFDESYIAWHSSVRRAIDWYLSTKDTDPTYTQLKALPGIPYLYANRYPSDYLMRLQKECGVERWSPCCARALEFMEAHNVKLDDVVFCVRPDGWSGDDSKAFLKLVSRSTYKVNGWFRSKSLFISLKEKTYNNQPKEVL